MKNKLETLIEQLITKLEDGRLDTETLQSIRFTLKYVMFDLEATRRERDHLRMILEDQE
jgi:hypothetical protein